MGLTKIEYEKLNSNEKEEKIHDTTKRFQDAGADAVILNMSELRNLLGIE